MGNVDLKETNVLVVDDTESMRFLISCSLNDAGFSHIIEAHDGKEALKKFKANPADLIICDWNMPNMDGLQLLKALRPTALDRSFRFMLVTAESDPKKVKEAIALGVDDIVTKPFQPGELIDRAIDLLNNRIRFPIPKHKLEFVVVEDSPIILEVLVSMLDDLGFKNTKQFTDSEEALKYIKKNKVDMIFSDWYMPKFSGLDMYQELQKMYRTRLIPFILITAENDIERIREAIELGVHGYLVKPFHHDTIYREIGRIYKLHLSYNS